MCIHHNLRFFLHDDTFTCKVNYAPTSLPHLIASLIYMDYGIIIPYFDIPHTKLLSLSPIFSYLINLEYCTYSSTSYHIKQEMEQGVFVLISLVICMNISGRYESCKIIRERMLIASNIINFDVWMLRITD